MVGAKGILIAYFSWSGNTRELAKQIHQLVGGDIYEIKPLNEYPGNYTSVLKLSKQEIISGERREIINGPASIDEYNYIFIGYSNWWNNIPSPVYTFLSGYSMKGRVIIPFCTHGGGGFGHSIDDIRKHCPDSKVMNGVSLNGNHITYAISELEIWLRKLDFSL